MTVRSTRHGPVISDVFGPLKNEGDPKDKEFMPSKIASALNCRHNTSSPSSGQRFTPSTPFEAIWGFEQAQNWEEFREAARTSMFPHKICSMQMWMAISAIKCPGDIPIRANGDGTLPVPGWTDEYEWTGYIPFEELPYTFNPAEGYIATANNQVPPRDYPYLITTDWDYGFRANRIVDMIENAPGKIDIAYIQKMQGDNYDGGAEYILSPSFGDEIHRFKSDRWACHAKELGLPSLSRFHACRHLRSLLETPAG